MQNLDQPIENAQLSNSVKKPKFSVLNIALQALLAAIVCWATLEVIFALAFIGETEHIAPDEVVDYKPFPNKRVTYRTEGFGISHYNLQGMQNAPINADKAAGVIRIGVFGDSYVEALQVNRSENFVSQLAHDLETTSHKKVETLNFGVGNYSIAQDYLRYAELGKKFHLDVAILCFRERETDKLLPSTAKALAFVKPVFLPDGAGGVKYDNTAVVAFLKSSQGKRMKNTELLREYSRTWSVVGRMWLDLSSWWEKQNSSIKDLELRIKGQQVAAKTGLSEEQDLASRESLIRCHWPMMHGLLAKFNRDCNTEGTTLVIVRLPKIDAPTLQLENFQFEETYLHNSANQLGVPYLNLVPILQGTVPQQSFPKYIFEQGHFTPIMHSFVADQISRFLLNGPLQTSPQKRPSDLTNPR